MSADRDDAVRAVLAERLQDLERARDALELSYRRVVSPDTIDALTRSEDGMIEIEVPEPILPLDRIHRAEKRGRGTAASDRDSARGLCDRISHENDTDSWRQIVRRQKKSGAKAPDFELNA